MTDTAQTLVQQMTVPEMISQLRHDAPAIPRLGIPAYNWWNEGLHGAARSGTATVFPQAIALASLFDPELLFSIAQVISTEQRAKYNLYNREHDHDIYKGLTVWSPNINIFRDPRWGRGQETFGEDPYLTSRLAVSFIQGLQGSEDILKTASCVKHLAAHSGPEPERHSFNAVVSKKDLNETYLPAFKAAVQEAGVDAVMGAYSALNGEPCCGSPTLIKQLLRDTWGFKGMYISDCWAIRDFHLNHKVTKNEEESAALALHSGCDLNCGCSYRSLEKAFQKGYITMEEIRTATQRVFNTRFRLGMFDEQTPYDNLGLSDIDSEEHAELALEASRRSLVLLKNESILPLNRERTRSIAVIGPNADSRKVLWGNYHGTSSRYTTVLEGLRMVAGNTIRINYSEGSSLTKERVERLAKEDDRLSEAAFMARQSDVTVLCLGLDETVEGEMRDDGNGGWAGDKKDLRLPLCQQKLLRAVAETEKPVIVVLLSGGAIDPEIEQYENVQALIQGWYPGQEGGRAIAELLFGMFSPSGKLPVTFYRSSAELPPFTDYSMQKRTYRYCEQGDVLYPFGFGLSYASFAYSIVGIAVHEDGTVNVRVSITNTTETPSRTVLELYLESSHPDFPPHPVLCGIKSVFLKSFEQKEVVLLLEQSQCTAVDNQGNRNDIHGTFTLYAGGSQPDATSRHLGADKVASTTFVY
ncbi:glycoside hydrolase family 3 C-terminal domain-containing protein [uncultured Sphaerochaeta sp.]|uniref:glycoside hydrolase family 3 C-terminal domain-containing protein n=1 Tax=uncultured Sphaerochaeta sp. TaxID=886478 RepID=UPI002A0A6491|nr:glycoside hydrolase family 3 C-terminal domain-containing protein [uncultured Sphaerochaeta sp.]